jgi:DHA1 family bicyclomycin/chloramphenicol resistance-like MFS transporter
MYLPAMPVMMTELNTDIGHMHLTLSAYLTGFALFHLLCGPLADRFGRKPILTGGTLLFIAACIGCSQSTSVNELLVYRFIQGIGACVGPTLARTITRDLFGPTRAARALSIIAMLMALAPAVAPGIGGIMLLVWPWWSIFLFLGAYGVAITVLLHRYLPESLPQRQSLHPAIIARNYGELLVDPFYLSVTAGSSLVYAAMMAYLSSSSFVYIEMLGVPVEYFGLIFLTTVIGYMIGSGTSARLSSRLDSEQVMLFGTSLCLVSVLIMWGGSLLWPASVYALMVPMASFTAGMGLVLPHAMAIALRPFPHIAGTASAAQGFIQMSLSASVGAVVGVFLQDTPQPMLMTMAAATTLSLLLSWRVFRRYQRLKSVES